MKIVHIPCPKIETRTDIIKRQLNRRSIMKKLHIENTTGVAKDTKIKDEEGREITNIIRSIEMTILPGEPTMATINICYHTVSAMVETQNTHIKNLDRLNMLFSQFGYKLVKDNG